MIKTGLIGNPLKLSLSPKLFELFSDLTEEKFNYILKEVRPAQLLKAVNEIKTGGWNGFNVTAPLKERSIMFIDKLDSTAAAIGAVNTVNIRNGKLFGFNTDAGALKHSLKEIGAVIKGKTCVIWGSGGAARTTVWALADGNAAEIHLRCRNAAAAHALTAHFSRLFPRTIFKSGKFFTSIPPKASVFINATPLGMYKPLPKALKIPDVKTGVYCDFAYAPGGKSFLKDRPGKTIPGLDLLICQAILSAAIWTGRRVSAREIVELKERIKRRLTNA